MYLCNKICSFIVKADTKKEAYINGCKRAAKYIASNEYRNISCKIEKISDCTFKFVLFTSIDISEEMKHYCDMCKAYHCSFFVNEDYNCSRCNLRSFFDRTKKKADISKKFYEEKIKNKEI